MFTYYPVCIVLLLVLSVCVSADEPHTGIDVKLARAYFNQAEKADKRDGGKLWGVQIYGPVLFVDAQTRKVVANSPTAGPELKLENGVYVGKLPADVNIANYAMEWAGKRWSMVIWQMIPADELDRTTLILHESFHRIQDSIGLKASDPTSAHLDTLEGRYWIQLEWNALNAALHQNGKERRASLKCALDFHNYRESLFPGSTEIERALMRNEGLAEYTGATLAAKSAAEMKLYAERALKSASTKASFARSFAYMSGPLYGAILNELSPGWTHKLGAEDDEVTVLQRVMKWAPTGDLKAAAVQFADKFGGKELMVTETKREEEKQARVAVYRHRFLESPILELSLDKFSFSFNPNTLVPLDKVGTVYPTARITCSWGILEVEQNGVLLTGSNGSITGIKVSLPTKVNAKRIEGDGWKLEIAPGWKLTEADAKGNVQLKHE